MHLLSGYVHIFPFDQKKKKKFQTEQQLGKKIQQSHNYINY